MEIANKTYPARAQLEALGAEPGDQPIVMVNLLKFRKKAAYKDGRDPDLSGQAAYMRYGRAMRKIVEKGGGRFLYEGSAERLVIGDLAAGGELWDVVALVEYPSAQEFVKIASSPEVAELAVHREAGLEGQLLIQAATAQAVTGENG